MTEQDLIRTAAGANTVEDPSTDITLDADEYSLGVRAPDMELYIERAGKTSEGFHQMTIAANEEARDGIELKFGGMSFAAYRRNPVVLWAHNMLGARGLDLVRLLDDLQRADRVRGLPIGRTRIISRTSKGIEVTFEFRQHESVEEIEQAWAQGFLRAASIGWMPTEMKRNEDAKPGEAWLTITKSELLEWSLVPVPADKDAVRELAEAMWARLLQPGQAPTYRFSDDGALDSPVGTITASEARTIFQEMRNEADEVEAEAVAQTRILEILEQTKTLARGKE